MSGFIGGPGFQDLAGIIAEDDDRQKPQYVTLRHPAVIVRDGCKDPVGYSAYRNPWWGSRSSFGPLGDAGDNGLLYATWHDLPELTRGANTAYWIRGYARDANGNLLASVTLKLYHTTDDTVQSTYLSNADGSYSLNTPYTDGHYIVAYKAGPPDVEGTTVNTLIPGT